VPADNTQIFGLLSGIFALLSFLPYIRSIKKGKTKPERSAWWIWSFLMIVALLLQKSQGAKWSLLLTVSLLLGNLAVAILSLKKGYGRFKLYDAVALLVAVGCVILWRITNNSLLALALIISVDCLGNILVINKSWKAPYSENLGAWMLGFPGAIFGLMATGNFYSQKAIFPAYLVLINLVTISSIFERRRWRKKLIKIGIRAKLTNTGNSH
jgi:hypothetical protein